MVSVGFMHIEILFHPEEERERERVGEGERYVIDRKKIRKEFSFVMN